MARPTVTRSVKRFRLRALDMLSDVAGQLAPSFADALVQAGGRAIQRNLKPRSEVAAKRKRTRA